MSVGMTLSTLARFRLLSSHCAFHRQLCSVPVSETSSVVHLRSRGVVRMSSNDEAGMTSFLQSLVTADISRLQHHSPQQSMMLNARGRVLLDVLVYRGQRQLYLETDAVLTSRLRSLLTIYLVRRRIAVEDVSGTVLVCWTHQNSFEEQLRSAGCQILASGPDPRCSLLGQRILIYNDRLVQRCLVDDHIHYHMLRMSAGIPEGATEIPYGGCTPLEYNGDYSGAVSFDKGCYIGQELTARTYHTGVIRKRVMPISWLGKNPSSTPVFGSVVKGSNGKSAGKLVASLGDRGLALLNVQLAMSGDTLSAELHGDNLLLTADRASWWPSDSA